MNKFAFAVFATAHAFSNKVPVYGTRPGWVQGNNKSAIEVEIVFDYMCSDSRDANEIWTEVIRSQSLESSVYDQVSWVFTSFSLPYHIHSFQVA